MVVLVVVAASCERGTPVHTSPSPKPAAYLCLVGAAGSLKFRKESKTYVSWFSEREVSRSQKYLVCFARCKPPLDGYESTVFLCEANSLYQANSLPRLVKALALRPDSLPP